MTKLTRALAALTLTAAPMAVSAELVLSFTDQSPNRGTRVENTIWLADEIAKRTDDAVSIEFHWGGALMKAKAAPEGIGSGAADMGLIIGVYNPSVHHMFTLMDLPTDHSDIWVTTRALYEMVQENDTLRAEFDDLNLHMVANVSTGPIQLVCEGTEITDTSQIDGLKLRGVGVYGKVFSELGAEIVPMSIYDTYQGLDTGLIDCAQMYTYTIPAYKLPEVADHVTLMDWGALMGIAIVMNKDVYDGLTDAERAVVDQVGSEFVDRNARALAADNADAVKTIKEGSGDMGPISVVDLSDAQKAALLDASAPFVEAWKAKAADMGVDGDAMVADWHARLDKWQAKLDQDGYPWDG